MTTTMLKPTTAQKSFYGKAKIHKLDNGAVILQSYDTTVCGIDETGRFIRLWAGWSATTAKHINSFREKYGLPRINKADWTKMYIG